MNSAMDNGPAWTPVQLYATSADASATELPATGAPKTGKKIVIDDLLVAVDADLTLTIRTATTKTVMAKFKLLTASPMQLTFRNGFRAPDADELVEILTSGAGAIYTTCSYHSE